MTDGGVVVLRCPRGACHKTQVSEVTGDASLCSGASQSFVRHSMDKVFKAKLLVILSF